MAKYIGSPWGEIRGKLDDAVGGVWKGIKWVRVRVLPTQLGTLEKYYLLKADPPGISPEQFSFPQFNIRRLVFQLLGTLGRMNKGNMILPVWERLAKMRNYALTGINLFVKTSAGLLWHSIPDPSIEYDITTNKPDLDLMKVSDGDLEGTTTITDVRYATATGILTVTFDSTIYKNGKDDDDVYVMAYREPIVDATWRANGYLYGNAITSLATRTAGTASITLPLGIVVGPT